MIYQEKQSPTTTAFASLVVLLLIIAVGCTTKTEQNKTDTQESITSNNELRHLVLFKFKEDADPNKIEEVEAAFEALPAKIPEIRSFEWGLNNSPEELNKGFTHCYLVTFSSEDDREVYLPHDDHQAFVALLGDVLDDVLVVDYWVK